MAASPGEPLESPGEPPRHDLAALYQTWFRPVYRWIRALGGPSIDAEDLTQEVFIVVQRKLAQFDGRNIGSWLYRIVQLTVCDHRRRAWFRNIFSRPRNIVLDDVISPAISQADEFERVEREAYLYQLVNQLNPRWRDSFLLFEVSGLTGDEIAALRGIPPATVRTHVARARKELIGLLAKHKGGIRQ